VIAILDAITILGIALLAAYTAIGVVDRWPRG
jgi:hypothetical protein